MIYILEDDDSIRELVNYALVNQGYEVSAFADPAKFWKGMQTKLPQLLILDLMLPGEDGISILQKIKSTAATRNLPIILLTAKSSEFDKVQGLDAGADDYLTKPFGIMELLARIRALLRRAEPQEGNDVYHWEKLQVIPAEHRVLVEGEEIKLTLKEYELLTMLISQPERVFTRELLLDQIWGYGFDGETRTIDVHIRTLRKKLGSAGDFIITVRGVGYKLGTVVS